MPNLYDLEMFQKAAQDVKKLRIKLLCDLDSIPGSTAEQYSVLAIQALSSAEAFFNLAKKSD